MSRIIWKISEVYFINLPRERYNVQFKYKCAKQTPTCLMFTSPELKLCNSFLDEGYLKMFKIKLKSNLEGGAINKKCKYYNNIVQCYKWFKSEMDITI